MPLGPPAARAGRRRQQNGHPRPTALGGGRSLGNVGLQTQKVGVTCNFMQDKSGCLKNGGEVVLLLLPACNFPSPHLEDDMLCPKCVRRSNVFLKSLHRTHIPGKGVQLRLPPMVERELHSAPRCQGQRDGSRLTPSTVLLPGRTGCRVAGVTLRPTRPAALRVGMQGLLGFTPGEHLKVTICSYLIR